MSAHPEYYHARKIDAQRFGSIAAESEVVGNFLQCKPMFRAGTRRRG
jgi:hypothetical protein